jgi:protein gp37
MNPAVTAFCDDIICREDNLDLPLHTKKPTVWAIWNDLFHADVPDDFRDRAYAVMALCPQHTFLVLTKRAAGMAEYFELMGAERRMMFSVYPASNVWHGVTVENQEQADARIPHLLTVPGKRFLSLEPMLGPIGMWWYGWKVSTYHRHGIKIADGPIIHAVLLGGESGRYARPMNPDWARDVRDQCAAAGVPYFHKQNGEFASVSEVEGPGYHHVFEGGATVRRVGKKRAGRTLDGCTHDDLPWEVKS